ncbi:hypothetical protein IC229_35000 [Spirosoma sp. BT702]|uniref:Uncharacterized protein n=1 Tax=Spirosoma profusum TaxID=2771354 RepID=A0A927AWV3_9BACT|nr:hypothetical protein [Spirosoma profusum]MBD2705859.1 hypothetical protein [Spirosoma profusum]
MQPIIKILFCIPLIINGLISTFYFVMTFYSLLFPPGPAYTAREGIPFLLGCATILGLLWWAYWLAILHTKPGAGFGVLALSYLAWPVLLLILFLLGGSKGWH